VAVAMLFVLKMSVTCSNIFIKYKTIQQIFVYMTAHIWFFVASDEYAMWKEVYCVFVYVHVCICICVHVFVYVFQSVS
jgi:hypothetical protein